MYRIHAAATAIVWAIVVNAGAEQGTSGKQWPSFRGPNASGVADGHALPAKWDLSTGQNVAWKTPIPGLAHSSPIVWDDRIFVTTAVSDKAEPVLRVGLYGESPDNPEPFDHAFVVICLDKRDGKVLWQRESHRGVPQVQRHIKSTHANSTPATDGTHVVALFGSEGMYCYDFEGNLLWQKNLGYLDSGAFNAPEIQWGFGSSPIIHDGRAYVQCDFRGPSFLAAFDVRTGDEIWRKKRVEYPGWGTPGVLVRDGETQIVVNGYMHVGGYDAVDGREIWKMSGGGDVPVPTPVIAHDLVYITSAHGPMSPLSAIRANATGVFELTQSEAPPAQVAWSQHRRGAYMQTPLVYGDLLYNCKDNGILTCYNARTGDKVYSKRLGSGRTGFSASAVAGDGKVYYTSEEGTVFVIHAGREFGQLAENTLGEICMATPAISDGTLLFRARHHLMAIRDSASAPAAPSTDQR